MGEFAVDLLKRWAHGRDVARQANLDAFRRAGLQIVEMNLAELLVHDGARSSASRFDVQALVAYRLAYLAGSEVVGEQRDRAVAVGEEIDLLSDPHRVEDIRVFGGDFVELGIGEASDPDLAGPPAAVPLPSREGGRIRFVGQALGIRRKRSECSHGQVDRGGEFAVNGHEKKAQKTRIAVA